MNLIQRITSKNKILKNFSVLTLSNVLTQVLLIFTSIKVARSLDPKVFGTYNLLQLHTSIILVISSLGIKNIIIRTVARNREVLKKVFKMSIAIRATSFLISIVLFTAYFIFYGNYDSLLFVLVIISIAGNTLFDVFEGLAFGMEKMEFSGIINFIATLIWVITIISLPGRYLNLHLIYGLFVTVNIIKTIIYFFSLYRQGYLKNLINEKIDKHQLTGFQKESLPYYWLALLTLLSNQIPLLFLEYRSGVEQIGYFNIASKVLMPINLVLTTVLAAIFPTFSRLFISDYKAFIKNVKTVFILVSLFGIAGAFGITFFRSEIIHLLYGQKYNNSSLVLGYQCWYIAFYGGLCLIGSILGAINRQKEMSYLSIICTVIQVPILWVGSKYGAEYLSAAFLLATTITFILHIYVINLYLRDAISVFFYVKIFITYIVGYAISLLIPENMNFLNKALIFIGIIAFAALLIYKKFMPTIRNTFSKKKEIEV